MHLSRKLFYCLPPPLTSLLALREAAPYTPPYTALLVLCAPISYHSGREYKGRFVLILVNKRSFYFRAEWYLMSCFEERASSPARPPEPYKSIPEPNTRTLFPGATTHSKNKTRFFCVLNKKRLPESKTYSSEPNTPGSTKHAFLNQ